MSGVVLAWECPSRLATVRTSAPWSINRRAFVCLYEVGLSTAQTPFGHDVPVYDMERTICDVLRSRSHIEMQTFQDALKAYARRKDKDLRTLVRYAKLFRVEKILRQYLEVLL